MHHWATSVYIPWYQVRQIKTAPPRATSDAERAVAVLSHVGHGICPWLDLPSPYTTVGRTLFSSRFLYGTEHFVPYLEARLAETEADFLAVLCQAVRRHGPPSALYVDNGACYRGESLTLVCARLGIRLVHAAPYDAPARGKQERFWRTLREQCLDLIEGATLDSLHAVNIRLWQWLDERYHRSPHGGLVGRTPSQAWLAATNTLAPPVSDDRMAQVLELRAERKVKKDSTLQWHGKTYEVVGRYLAGRTVTVISSLLDPSRLRLEHLGKPIEVFPVDVHQNAHCCRRPRRPSTPPQKEPHK
jgi:putative transposase